MPNSTGSNQVRLGNSAISYAEIQEQQGIIEKQKAKNLKQQDTIKDILNRLEVLEESNN